MEKLIFGSTALKYWFPDFHRVPKDLDYISKFGKSSPNIEYHWASSFQYILDNNKHPIYVDPDFLYTIKVSHAAWDIRWDKTMKDIIFLKNKRCKLDYSLYNSLIKDWESIHSKKKIALKGSPDQFFNSNITRTMNHDELHELVKFYDSPLHESIRRDKTDVACSKALWEGLPREDQIKCALEEIYVFALERYNEYPPNLALLKAIKQLITKSTKGYFNLFLIENFEELYYNRDRFKEIRKKYDQSTNSRAN